MRNQQTTETVKSVLNISNGAGTISVSLRHSRLLFVS